MRRPVVLVGASFGATVAADFTFHHPGLVAKLVLLSATVVPPPAPPPPSY